MKKQGQVLSQSLHCSLLGLLSFVISTLILAFSATFAHSAEVTLAWDPNTAQDLAGYKIYYKTEFSGPPYNGTGFTEGDSPIDVGNQMEFTLHGLTDDVTYFFVATAYDTEGLESDYSEELIYETGNHPPVADAGPDQTVNEGVAVTLDGSNSTDPDDGIASYLWKQTSGPLVILSSADEIQSTFTAPDVGPNGASLTFRLTVTDNGNLQATDTCIVNVTDSGNGVNQPPTADAGPDQTVDEGETVTLDGTGSSDPDDGIASYLWKQTGGTTVTLSNITAAIPTFVTPPVDLSGTTLTFQLTVTDNGDLESSDEVSLTIDDNGITGFPDDVVTLTCSTGYSIGVKEESGGNCVSLCAVDPSTIADNTNRPENLIYGLFDIQIKTDIAGGTVEFTFYLSTPAPDDYTWFKYSPTNGWSDFSANTTFNSARDQVTLTLTDGGAGDDDGVANRIIVDPSGLGSVPEPSSTPSDGREISGCFIATAAYGTTMEPHVKIFREFRDRFLLNNRMGKAFVHIYNTYSPPVADFIANHDTLRALVRWSLLPVVGMTWISINFGSISSLVFIILLLSLISVTTVVLFKRIRQ